VCWDQTHRQLRDVPSVISMDWNHLVWPGVRDTLTRLAPHRVLPRTKMWDSEERSRTHPNNHEGGQAEHTLTAVARRPLKQQQH
jgi:hypothetical protein